MIGPPKRIQSDLFTEFQGAVKVFFKRCGIISSRVYDPQAQGKIESSHGTWKNKLRYDIFNCVEGDIYFFYTKGWNKPVQHFIQHHVFALLDEMLEWFAPLQNL